MIAEGRDGELSVNTSKDSFGARTLLSRFGILIGVLALLQVLFVLGILAAQLPSRAAIDAHIAESQDNPLLANVFDYSHEIAGAAVNYDNNRYIVLIADQHEYDTALETAVRATVDDVYPNGDDVRYVTHDYARYWHGWQLLTNVALLLGPISVLQLIVFLLTILSTVGFFWELYKCSSLLPAACFTVLALLSTNVFFNFLGDLLLAISTFVVLAFCALILRVGRCSKRTQRKFLITLMCMVTGAVYNYLDFLAIPGFCFALIVFCAMLSDRKVIIETKNNAEWHYPLLAFVKYSLAVLVGFLVTWAFKWLLMGIVMGFDNTVLEVTGRISNWSGAQSMSIIDWPELYYSHPRIYSLYFTLKSVLFFQGEWHGAGIVAVVVVALLVIAAIVRLLYERANADRRVVQGEQGGYSIFWLLLPCVIPLMYYTIMYTHAIVHIWMFSYKPWAIVFAIVAFVACEVLDGDKVSRSLPEKRKAPRPDRVV